MLYLGYSVLNCDDGLRLSVAGADDGREFDPANFKSALNELTMKALLSLASDQHTHIFLRSRPLCVGWSIFKTSCATCLLFFL